MDASCGSNPVCWYTENTKTATESTWTFPANCNTSAPVTCTILGLGTSASEGLIKDATTQKTTLEG